MRILLVAIVLLSSSIANAQTLPLVPKPSVSNMRPGTGPKLASKLTVSAPIEWQPHLEVFGEYLNRCSDGCDLEFITDGNPFLLVRNDKSLEPEEYILEISSEQIELRASTLKGLAHSTASLLQLAGNAKGSALPLAIIKDAPAVPYRNFMVDMGRNPHSIELLKETVDLLWYYKLDSLQLHLTDDQRFAWPSTAYPKLWDGKITLEEFRELESYAVQRGITIIPELEVPGHSGKLRQIYPEVFGKSPTDLATSEDAFDGIKTLLDELMEVFASTPYIHIGGDEAYGVPVVAQRNLINRLHAYLKSCGRQTIVWEGPDEGMGENKVNEEVIHINWRTIAYRPDQMLQAGYRVINAAWDPLYVVDHYPRTNFTMTSPQHIYDTLKLTRFKHVNPGIPTFGNPIDVPPSDQLIGFCMPWWEGREENYFPQVVPRLIPFAEAAWHGDAERSFSEFGQREELTEAARLAACYPITINASNLAVPQDGVFHEQSTISFSLSKQAANQQPEIHYTLDGAAPSHESPVFAEPLEISSSTVVRAAAFVDSKQLGHGTRLQLTCVSPSPNLALGKPVTSTAPSGSPFSVDRLTDGGLNNLDFYLGYPAEPEPIRITVDLEDAQKVNRVVVHSYSISNSFEKYTLEVSLDGKNFESVGSNLKRSADSPSTGGAARAIEHQFETKDVRFVRIVTFGNKGYVFDSFSKLVEIQVFGDTQSDAVSSKVIHPTEADYSRLAFYPDRWKNAGQDFRMLAWEGQNIAFFTRKGEYDHQEMSAFIKRLDAGWQVYSDLIGQQPRQLKSFNSKPVICAIPSSGLSCGYGCGYVGATGIEASAFYSVDLPSFRKNQKSFQHYYFYEMGRNFFVFGDRHSLFTTGYAVFMRYVCMDSLNCEDLDIRTRQTIESCEEIYAQSDVSFVDAFTNLGSGEKSNRLRDKNGKIISPSDQPVMIATAMLKLRREFGGDEWVKRFYHALLQCDSVRATSIESAQTQLFNWLVCASMAARKDLTSLFADRWRMPLSEKQRETISQINWSDEELSPKQIVASLVSAAN